MAYDPKNWYWTVANVADQKFFSGSPGYVSDTDGTYLSWVAEGNQASSSLTDGELAYTLLTAGVASPIIYAVGRTDLGNLAPVEKALLLSFLGINLTSTGTSALDGTYQLDLGSYINLTGIYVSAKVGDGLPGGGSTFNYPDITYTPHAFTEAAFLNFALAARDYLYALNQAITANSSLPSPDITIA